jgi:hypothetical protein
MRSTLRTTEVFGHVRRIRALILLATVVAATLVPPGGRAIGGSYAFAGGTPRRPGGAR